MPLHLLITAQARTPHLARTSSLAIIRMELLVHVLEMRVGDVRIDLGGRDVGVAQQPLHTADVGAVHEQISRKAVSQRMGCNVFGNARQLGVLFYNPLNAAGG